MADDMKPVFWNTKSDNVCAFCKKHSLWMTPKQMNKRQCIGRNCDALSPIPDHPIWATRAARKEHRKQRKERLEAQYMAAISKCATYEIRT